MGAIQDLTREHLGTSDKVIVANRRLLQQAIDTVEQGGTAPGIADPALHDQITGPETVDGSAPAQGWQDWWQEAVRARREDAPWSARSSVRAEPVEAHPQVQASPSTSSGRTDVTG
ncbi:hypothetical protein D9M68_771350 [compost metagenome]